MIRVDVGVFAHNESAGIAAMLEDVIRQEVTGLDVRVLVLANGCSDDTASRARALADATSNSHPAMKLEVVELSLGGKSRTWNRFVHELSRADADVLLFADADIHIPEPDSLAKLVQGLERNSRLYAFNSQPIKDIVHKPQNLSLLDKSIASATGTLNDWKTAICGSLYAMPAGRARDFHMPIGLAVEDGFLRAMILTDGMTAAEDFSRIDGGSVFHVYASERSPTALVRHQTRIVIGSAVNEAIFSALHKLPVAQRRAAMADAAAQEAWLPDVIRSGLPRWPFGWIPSQYLTKRVRFLASQPRHLLRPQKLLVLVVGFAFDCVVYMNAQLKMGRGSGAGYW